MTEQNSLDKLIFQFSKLPGVGRRTAQRYAYSVLEMESDSAKELSDAIMEVKEKIHECKTCGCFTDKEECDICSSRDKSMILVVESPKDVLTFERMQSYNGVYHVLHGTISPINHVTADDIRIKELLKRIDGVKEIILGLGSDVESEATAIYISSLLKPFNIKISRLAVGIPMGQDIEYSDEVTLSRAFEERKTL